MKPQYKVCTPAERAARRITGLGDVVAAITNAVGIPQCEPCNRRKETLNRLVPFGVDPKKNHKEP